MQGLRPCKENLGVVGEWNNAHKTTLRNRLLGLYLSGLQAKGRSHNIEDAEEFDQLFRPLMRSAESLALTV
jgi:hypothetical protein